jgi:hypothetical protein
VVFTVRREQTALEPLVVRTYTLNPSDPPGLSNPQDNAFRKIAPLFLWDIHSTIRGCSYGESSYNIHVKAQAAYIQDFPVKQQQQNDDNDNSDDLSSMFGHPTTSDFEETLVAYLDTYKYHKPHAWITPTTGGTTTERLTDLVRRYDFSTASVVLLPSTPGYHRWMRRSQSVTASFDRL